MRLDRYYRRMTKKAELHMGCLRELITQQRQEMHEKRRKAILISQLPNPFCLLGCCLDKERNGECLSFFLSDTAGTVLAKLVFVMRSAKASYLIYCRWWGVGGYTLVDA